MSPRISPRQRASVLRAISAGLGLACVWVWCVSGCGSASKETALHQAAPVVVAPEGPREIVVGNESWTFEDREGRLLTTPSYRIFTTSQRESLLRSVPMFMENALRHYTSSLGELPKPREPLETYLFSERPQWERMTRRLMGEDAGTYLQIQRGGYTSGGRAILYDIGRRDTYAIAAHEGWHQYTQRTFRNQLPITLEEGLATFMEGFRWDYVRGADPVFMPWANIERFDQLRIAQRERRLMALPDLLRSTPQQLIVGGSDSALTFYAQAWGLIHFLNEGEKGAHRAALREMLHDAAHGKITSRIQRELGSRAASAYSFRRQGIDLLKLYTGRSAEALDTPYQAFLSDVTRVGAKQKIVQGLSPIE